MNTHSNTPRSTPNQSIDTHAMASRLGDLARSLGCASCVVQLGDAVADIAALLIEVARLRNGVMVSRMDAANLRAAIQAALGADADGDPDALEYLRDELAEQFGVWGRE